MVLQGERSKAGHFSGILQAVPAKVSASHSHCHSLCHISAHRPVLEQPPWVSFQCAAEPGCTQSFSDMLIVSSSVEQGRNQLGGGV